ncbi:hypothetical protein N7520_006087 [Penicillium odoratum]|uniref:uncharacterized protein n=1 Tax=Penicillium odoratum TaxID=1167516 RepID=UPI002549B08F|nr:uncharacterized protein N7520_006087 [Penicillium odoratum]KAJ5758931.1 hypothetical protein N7520_006087 [Penicillium odoratum]
MDPVSFAVGIIGLAGLFSTCLEVVEKFDSFKEFGIESRSIRAQFKAQRLRLQQWGQDVGLQGDTLMEKHSKQLDDPRTYSIVEELLSAIRGICTYEDDLTLAPGSPIEHRQSLRDQLWPRQGRLTGPHDSKREKISWALRNKARKMAQVGQFCSLVDNLHDLVPVSGRGDVVSSKDVESDPGDDISKGNAVDRGGWITEFGHILSGIENEIEDEIKRDLHPWLLGPSSQNELFEISAGKRIQGTCEWALTRTWFLDWSSSDFSEGAKVLWINGPAGFGKSILCAKIVEHMTLTSKAPVAHFFFSSDFESRRDPFIAMRSWISQIMSNKTAFGLIRQKASENQGQKSTRVDIVQLLCEIVAAIPHCTFIIDGLDECSWVGDRQKIADGGSVFDFLETLMKAVEGTQARILIVSRDEPEIRNCLSGNAKALVIYRHRITPDDVRSDTETYSRIIVNKKLSNRTEATKEDIAMKLSNRCNGQFLWVKMQEDCLRSGKSQKKIEQAISSTPTGLEHTYERNWQKISQLPDEDRDRTISLLRWTAFALRPLTVNEITGALLVSPACDEVRLDELPDNVDEDYINTEILDLCGSLLEIRIPLTESHPGLRTVHLAHFSVKQYLLSNIPSQGKILQLNSNLKASKEALESTLLASMCLCYVDCEEVWAESPDNDEDKKVLTAFRDYAAGAWQKHAFLGDLKDEKFINLVKQLFDTENPSWSSWKTWFDLNDKEGGKGETPGKRFECEESEGNFVNQTDSIASSTSDCPLYYAAWMGLTEIVDYLVVKDKGRIDEKGNKGRTALVAACGTGNVDIVQKLLDNGADHTITDDDGQTPLGTSSAIGHYEVTKLLLISGANIESANARLVTPLYCASFKGHLPVVKLLLDHGANIEAHDINDWTPLHSAVAEGHIDTVKLLLDKGADVSFPNISGIVPLYTAARKGMIAMTRLLCEHGADINVSTQSHQWTPLNAASDLGHVDVVKFLIGNGADMTIRTDHGWTPLHSAADSGHLEVVRILYENGADIETLNENSMTPLYSAALQNHLKVVEFLLGNGANVNAQHDTGWTALNCAAEGGFVEVVNRLIDHGADLELANDIGMTPICTASLYGHHEVLNILLKHGADYKTVTKTGWSPFSAACSQGHAEVIGLLLKQTPDLESPDPSGWTPLNGAANRGHLEIVKMLLEKSANIESKNKSNMTPLYSASLGGHNEIVRLLLDNGADVNAQHKNGWTPLNSAASRGHLDVVKQLLAKGADIMITATDGWAPLNSAAESGHLEVVSTLLEYGANIESKITTGSTPLYCAASAGHLEVVRALIRKGADYTVPNKHGWTPVNVASSNGHIEVVRLLLAQNPPPSLTECDLNGYTPLNAASDHNHVEIVKLLLEKGAEITLETKNGSYYTPLYSAALYGWTEVLKILIDWGANVDAQTKIGHTAVNAASFRGQTEVVKLLLENGADISIADCYNATPLYSASVKGHSDIVRVLLQNGADVNISREGKWSPLNAAAGASPDIVKMLLAHGADVESAQINGRRPLHTAALAGDLETINLLFEFAKPELEAQDQCGRTPFFLAAVKGHVPTLKFLRSKSAVVDVRDRYGATPLIVAARNGLEETVQYLLLLTSPSEVSIEGGFDRSLLWWALGSESQQVIQLVRQFTEKASTNISETSSHVECSMVKFDHEIRWCDCVGFGAKCVDSTHDWETKEPVLEPEEPKDD